MRPRRATDAFGSRRRDERTRELIAQSLEQLDHRPACVRASRNVRIGGPDLLRERGEIVLGSGDFREEAHELLVDHPPRVHGIACGIESRKDRAHLGFVLVGVVAEVEPDGIVPERISASST